MSDEEAVKAPAKRVARYQPVDNDEARRLQALQFVEANTEPMIVRPDDFLAMCERVNEWLKSGLAKSGTPALSTIEGGKKSKSGGSAGATQSLSDGEKSP